MTEGDQNIDRKYIQSSSTSNIIYDEQVHMACVAATTFVFQLEQVMEQVVIEL